MAQKTGKYTLDGIVILSEILEAIGYSGTNALSLLFISNPNDTPVYLILDNQNTVEPNTPDDGMAIGNSEESTSFAFNVSQLEHFLDAGTTWVSSASAVDIKVTAIGGGA